MLESRLAWHRAWLSWQLKHATQPIDENRLLSYIKLLLKKRDLIEGNVYTFPTVAIALLLASQLPPFDRLANLSWNTVISYCIMAVVWCIGFYLLGRIFRSTIRDRLSNSDLATQLESGLLDDDPIYAATPQPWRFSLDAHSPFQRPGDEWDVNRLVNNLDYYLSPSAFNFRWRWVVRMIFNWYLWWFIICIIDIPLLDMAHNKTDALIVLLTNSLFLISVFFMIVSITAGAVLQHRKCIWHTELLDYLIRYLRQQEKAASAKPGPQAAAS